MWAKPLASRTSVLAWPSDRACAAFQKKEELARKRLAQRLGFTSMARAPVLDEAGTGMPPAKRSRFATDLERWCTAGSWAMCKHCRVLQPVDMTPTCFDRTPTPLLSEKNVGAAVHIGNISCLLWTTCLSRSEASRRAPLLLSLSLKSTWDQRCGHTPAMAIDCTHR